MTNVERIDVGPPRPPDPIEIEVAVIRLAHGDGLPLPAYATAHAAGMDLSAATEPGTRLTIEVGQRLAIPTAVAIALPQGFEAQVRPRSGLALKHGITVLNAPGTIDSDYRGEIKVVLINLGHQPFEFERGLRIAQLVVAPVSRIRWRPTEALAESGRGEGGFGSTDVGGEGAA